jgi:exopolyphosphatase / guanosine-5'-triphosphate,3'-diphosphate pyrophosphatase
MERTLSVLRDYRGVMDAADVERVRLVATSAVRDATNAETFMGAAAQITGVRPEVLSGQDEGLLSFYGATAHLPPEVARNGSLLVVDIGGGSTELTIGPVLGSDRPVAPNTLTVATRSLDIGCVRVTERFLRHDPPQPDELTTARAFVSEEVAGARDALPPLPPSGLLVGLAGTVSTLAALSGGVVEYDRARIHHALLGRDEVERWVETLSSETASQRLVRAGMVRGREDVIVGGVLILAAVMETFGCERCLVSEDDILDGLAATLLRSVPSPGDA